VESSKLTYRLAQAAYGLHAALEGELHQTLIQLDLTLPLADVLWQLDPALGPISRRELAERLGCDPSNVTFLIDRLERRRLVARARSSGDRRVRTLRLTEEGSRTRRRLIETIARSSIFTGLTSGEQRELTELLDRCLRN
jgi:DNA-binding MarR family transcriptional regulator